MKKQIVILGIITLLVCVGLSGCNQQSNSNTNNQTLNPSYSNLVEISNITVITKWYGQWGGKGGQIDGFFHNYTNDMYDIMYEVNGTVKNIATKPIDAVYIRVSFFDANGNYISESNDYVFNLYLGESESFSTDLWNISTPYFSHITKCTLQVTKVTLHQ